MNQISFTWKVKAGLIAFGVIFSLALSELVLELFIRPQKGTQFETLDEVRKAMLSPSSTGADNPGTGLESGNLRGLVAPHPNDQIIFDMIPNLDTLFQRSRVKLNSCGLRSPERAFQKPADTFRIALLGDSFAFGWGVKQEENFASVMEDTLNRISKGSPRFEVINFGTPGYSTFQEVAKFEEIGLQFSPDAVLVFFIENDFGLPFYVKDIYNPGSILSSVSFARLTWQAFDPKREEQKLQLTSYDPNRALARLSDLCRSRAIPLYVTINPKKGWKSHKRRLWILRERPDIKYINMRGHFMDMMERYRIPEKDLTLSWDPHPSPIRHRMYGTILTLPFMEYVR